ncbi:MAG: PEP-CTERM sorting domain-containing protein [Pedosphaera sp.]|nr:PEP-CTERM sorting domain-containing protein [Pedosphaera sp.]
MNSTLCKCSPLNRTLASFGFIGLALAGIARGDTTEGPFNFINNTGFKADMFNSVFVGTGGTLNNINVTVTPQPVTFSSVGAGNEVILGWTSPNLVNNGQNVTFTVNSAFSGIALNSSYWSRNGAAITSFWPINATPNTSQNYGNFPQNDPQELHSSLDVTAAVNTPVRAIVSGIITAVGGGGNASYISVSDGNNVYNYTHIKKVSGAATYGFTAADVGTAVTAGQNFAFILGSANVGGGSFDHLDLEYIPGNGTDAFLKKPDPANPGQFIYKTAAEQAAITDPARMNPLKYLPIPERDPGGNAPTIGPIFFQPKGANVAGYVEYGQKPTTPGVRAGTFVNGQLNLIQEIRDNQGSEPFTGNRNDPIDPTITVYNGLMSNPYKVSYQVMGQGVVAGRNINERTLVQFDGPWGTQSATTIAEETYDPRRNTTTAGTRPRNYSYVLNHTDGTDPKKANVWNTMAKQGGAAGTDGTGRPDALNNADAKFPDGVYEARGFGFDLKDDGTAGNKTSIPYLVRVNNWKQTAVATHGGPTVANPIRADDTFALDGVETFAPLAGLTFNGGAHEGIFGVGDNFLGSTTYTWEIVPHQDTWTEGDPFNCLLCGTVLTDADGHLGDTLLTDSFNLPSGIYDLVVDYDGNNAFSWTLDGVGQFVVVPEPSTTALLFAGLMGLLWWRRGLGFINLSLRRERVNKRTSSKVGCLPFSCLGRLLAGAVVAASVEPAVAALDLKLVSLTKRASDQQIEPAGIVGNRAGFTFSVKTENVGDTPISWGFPMYENLGTAWVAANANGVVGAGVYPNTGGMTPTRTSPQGFSGITEGINTSHTLPMPNPAPGPGPGLFTDPNFPLNKNFVGSHPHLQLTLWAQPGGSGAWQKIGRSDLKHAFSTVYPFKPPDQADGGDDYPAFSSPGEIDDYGNNSDRDRDFYGPMSEMNQTSFAVAKHLHLAGADLDPTINFRGADANGYDVYERAHGQKEHAGNALDHLLQADVRRLLINDGSQKFNGEDGFYAAGTKWFAAGTWYVVGDTDNNNNTLYRRFDPGWDGTKFVPSWDGASFDGSQFDAPAMFLPPDMAGAVPEPGSFSLLLLGGLVLLRRRRDSA